MRAEPTVVLVHSPVTGPSVWQPVAGILHGQGQETVVPSWAEVFAGPAPYYPKLAAAVADDIDRGRDAGGSGVVLVGHSGAGALLPAIADASAATVVGLVFVDALLPNPGRSWFDEAPADMREQLLGLAHDGLLPPWNEWFPPETLEHLLPDPDVRASFCSELPRVPVAYFEEPAPELPDPLPSRSGYLRLSDAYKAQADQAQREGWHVAGLSAHHLAMFTDPDEVAMALAGLIGALGR
jgi:hypothetical protein